MKRMNFAVCAVFLLFLSQCALHSDFDYGSEISADSSGHFTEDLIYHPDSSISYEFKPDGTYCYIKSIYNSALASWVQSSGYEGTYSYDNNGRTLAIVNTLAYTSSGGGHWVTNTNLLNSAAYRTQAVFYEHAFFMSFFNEGIAVATNDTITWTSGYDYTYNDDTAYRFIQSFSIDPENGAFNFYWSWYKQTNSLVYDALECKLIGSILYTSPSETSWETGDHLKFNVGFQEYTREFDGTNWTDWNPSGAFENVSYDVAKFDGYLLINCPVASMRMPDDIFPCGVKYEE